MYSHGYINTALTPAIQAEAIRERDVKKMKQKREKYINFAVCAAAFLFMLFLTAITPYFCDDWHFKFVWKDYFPVKNDELLQSFGGLIESAANYYKYSGGRVLCHFVLFIFESMNKWIFDIANAFVFVMLALLIYKLIRRDRKQSTPWLLPLIFIYIFVFYKDFGSNMLWESGALNYLWPAALLLFAAKLADTDIEKLSVGKFIFTCIIVFLSSMTNEVTGGMLAILIFLTLIERKSKFSARYILLFALIAAGIAIVLLSPGNSVRSDSTAKMKVLTSIWLYTGYYYRFCLPFIYISIFSILYFYDFKKNILSNLAEYKYFAAGTAGILVLFVVRSAFTRPLLFGWAFLAAGGGSSLYRLKDDITEKIKQDQPGLAIKLLKSFFYTNLFIEVYVILININKPKDIILYMDISENIILVTYLFVFMELTALILMRFIKNSTQKDKIKFVQSAKKVSAVFSKPAKFASIALSVMIIAFSISYMVKQTDLYITNVKAVNSYVEDVCIYAQDHGDFVMKGTLNLDNDSYSDYMKFMLSEIGKFEFGESSRFTSYLLKCETGGDNYAFLWLCKYIKYTGYTGRGY